MKKLEFWRKDPRTVHILTLKDKGTHQIAAYHTMTSWAYHTIGKIPTYNRIIVKEAKCIMFLAKETAVYKQTILQRVTIFFLK